MTCISMFFKNDVNEICGKNRATTTRSRLVLDLDLQCSYDFENGDTEFKGNSVQSLADDEFIE